MKMYILVKESVPQGLGINAVGHASLAGYLEYKDHPDTIEWLDKSFRKVTCLVSDDEFERAKKTEDCLVITENDYENADGNNEVALVFRPRKEWPKMFSYLRLYK